MGEGRGKHIVIGCVSSFGKSFDALYLHIHMPKFEMQSDAAVLYPTTQCFWWVLLEHYKVKCIIDLPAKRESFHPCM